MDIELKREGGLEKAVEEMADYWSTYHNQHGYQNYTSSIFLDDALYAIGISLNPDRYTFANGYRQFKEDLRKFLDDQ